LRYLWHHSEKRRHGEDHSHVDFRTRGAQKAAREPKFQKNVIFPEIRRLPSIALDADDVASKLTLKLFGKRDYKYQMVLAEPISHQLYKERNFDLKINIVDA
jgi:hypothetical protein